MSEHRDPVTVEVAVEAARNGKWDFLSKKGLSLDEKVELFRQSSELCQLARAELCKNSSFGKLLPKDALVVILTAVPLSTTDDDVSDPDYASDSDDADDIPDVLFPDDIFPLGDDDVVEDSEDESEEESEEEPGDDVEEDSFFKKAVLFLQALDMKQVASALGIILSIILMFVNPIEWIALLVGIVPLACGLTKNVILRNSFRPLKLFWCVVSFLISLANALLAILLILVSVFVIKSDKIDREYPIPPRGTDAVIASFFTLTKLGIPLPWRKFTIERSGNKLRLENVVKLYGGNNSHLLQAAKDPEIKSSFATVVFGGYQYLVLTDTKTEKKVLSVRLPSPVVQSLHPVLVNLCEVAKSQDELGGTRVIHS